MTRAVDSARYVGEGTSALLLAPDFVRPAEQHERDIAGAAQRRLEASLHRYWLALAAAATGDWWNRLVPAPIRAEAARPRRGRAESRPDVLIRRLPFDGFIELFATTFPRELDSVLGGGGRRRIYVLELLLAARDAASHPGRPYLAVEARMTAATAWELARRIPLDHHDPPDQLGWLASQSLIDAEGFDAEDWDVCSDCLMAPELWADLHRLVTRFKPLTASGDAGFARAVEGFLGVAGLNVFLRAGELTLGTGLSAFSGLFHEHDLGVIDGPQLVVMELKHRRRGGISKDDLLLFNQKTLDFELALIRAGTRSRLVRAFVTNDRGVKDSLRAFCVQWGILLVEPELPPIPTLVAALRDLEGSPAASASPRFESSLLMAEKLGRCIRPLDRILVPSTLSSWRRLIDAGAFPSGSDLDGLVQAHRDLTGYALELVGKS